MIATPLTITLEYSHPVFSDYSMLSSQKATLSIITYHLQYTQHPNFYFPILLIKIIYLHIKII